MVELLIGLLALVALEIVLGVDNVIFISILVEKLPIELRDKARKLGLFLAMFMRIILICFVSYLISLNESVLTIINHSFSIKDLILISGGLFLLYKAVNEIKEKFEHLHTIENEIKHIKNSFWLVIFQILIIDIVFSLDSVITAAGMVTNLWVMIAAVVISVLIMMFFAKPLGDFILKHQRFQLIAFAFLMVVGVFLIIEGTGQHIDKGYLYFAMSFVTFIEFINFKLDKKVKR